MLTGKKVWLDPQHEGVGGVSAAGLKTSIKAQIQVKQKKPPERPFWAILGLPLPPKKRKARLCRDKKICAQPQPRVGGTTWSCCGRIAQGVCSRICTGTLLLLSCGCHRISTTGESQRVMGNIFATELSWETYLILTPSSPGGSNEINPAWKA